MTDTTQAARLTDLADWLRKEAHDCEYGAVCTAMDHPQAMQSLMRSRATMLRRFEGAVRAALAAQAVPADFKWPKPPKRGQSSALFDDGYDEGWARCIDTLKAMLAASPAPAEAKEEQILPNPGSPEASAMIDSLLAEYHYPANPKNAARAGYEAARRMLAALRSTQGGE